MRYRKHNIYLAYLIPFYILFISHYYLNIILAPANNHPVIPFLRNVRGFYAISIARGFAVKDHAHASAYNTPDEKRDPQFICSIIVNSGGAQRYTK